MAIWQAVRESALRRLGKPLLLAYAGLAVTGAVVVVTWFAWIYR